MGALVQFGGRLSGEGQLAADTAKLKALARTIETEAQFEALIDLVDPDLRAEVRALVGPMLTCSLSPTEPGDA